MASPVPDLAPKLADALQVFRDSGIEPTAAEIVWLADLRRACDRPHDGSVPWVMGSPVEYGGVKFYPLHRLAESWFVRSMAIAGDDELKGAIYLFAHAHSGVGDVTVRDLSTMADLERVVRPWFEALPIHEEQAEALCEVLARIDGGGENVPDPDKADEQAPDHEQASMTQFVSLAMRAFPGVAPSFWLTDMPSAAVREMMCDVSSDGSGWAVSAQRTQAITNWLRAVKWVWRNHSE